MEKARFTKPLPSAATRRAADMTITSEGPTMPGLRPATTILVDTDAIIDLDVHEELVREKRWLHYFLNISEAPERNPQLRDVLELAAAEGLRVAYSSRWPELTAYLVKPWIQSHGMPEAFVNWRRNGWATPAELGGMHAVAAGRHGAVLFIHNDSEACAQMRQRFGIAALTPAQLPQSVEGLRRVFALARPVEPFELPKKSKNSPKKKEEAA